MSIDIANEAGIDVDEVGLVAVARFTLDQMRIHPLAELSVLLVDERTMTELHERWMGEPGPTDVLAFPMDELRPPHLGGNRDDPGPEPGLLGDVVLCPQVAAEQAGEGRPFHPGRARAAVRARHLCTCSATTTPSPRSTPSCSAPRISCSRPGKSERDAKGRPG